MARFFIDELPLCGTEYTLTGENAEHAKVLRLRPGEEVALCDGRGSECVGTVLEGLRLQISASCPSLGEPKTAVRIYIAFPKADKAEHVIQKATELGAAEIILFPTAFCVSRPDEKSLKKKLERWQKIARSAAEQSRRGVIPVVRAHNSYTAALRDAAAANLPILFYENERARTLRAAMEAFLGETNGSALDALPQPSSNEAPSLHGDGAGRQPAIALMTGAEGGFSEEEIAEAEAAGMKICTLGPRILRCETAPLAALSAVMYALGEM